MSDPLGNLEHDAGAMARSALNVLILDDVRTAADVHEPYWKRTLAIISIASNVTGPEGRAIDMLAKPILEHAVESLGEHQGATALKALLEKSGHGSTGAAARLLRTEAAQLTEHAKAKIEHMLEHPAMKPLVDRVTAIGSDVGKRAEFVQGLIEATGVAPVLSFGRDAKAGEAMAGESLGKRAAMAMAVALGQRIAVHETVEVVESVVGGTERIASDVLAVAGEGETHVARAARETVERASGTAHTVERWTKGMSHEAFDGRAHLAHERPATPVRNRGIDIER